MSPRTCQSRIRYNRTSKIYVLLCSQTPAFGGPRPPNFLFSHSSRARCTQIHFFRCQKGQTCTNSLFSHARRAKYTRLKSIFSQKCCRLNPMHRFRTTKGVLGVHTAKNRNFEKFTHKVLGTSRTHRFGSFDTCSLLLFFNIFEKSSASNAPIASKATKTAHPKNPFWRQIPKCLWLPSQPTLRFFDKPEPLS